MHVVHPTDQGTTSHIASHTTLRIEQSARATFWRTVNVSFTCAASVRDDVMWERPQSERPVAASCAANRASTQPYNITHSVSLLSQLTAAITLDRYISNDVHVISTPSHAILRHAFVITFVQTLLRYACQTLSLSEQCHLHVVSRVLVHVVVVDICAR